MQWAMRPDTQGTRFELVNTHFYTWYRGKANVAELDHVTTIMDQAIRFIPHFVWQDYSTTPAAPAPYSLYPYPNA